MPHQTFLSEEATAWSAPCQLPRALRTPALLLLLLPPLSKDHGSDGTSFQRMWGTVQPGKQTKWEDVIWSQLFGFFFAVVPHFCFSFDFDGAR